MLDNLRRWAAHKLDPERRSVTLGISPRIDPSSVLATIQGRSTAAGVKVNPGTALGIAAFWACVDLISSVIADLPLEIGREEARDDFLPARNDPRYLLLRRRPNETTPKFHLWQTVVQHSLLYRGGFLEIEESNHSREVERYALGLHLMDPRSTKPIVNPDRSVEYEFDAGSGKKDRLPARSVVHIRGMSWDGVQGYSLVDQAADILGVAKAQLLYEGSVYGNGAQKGVVLESPSRLDSKQKDELRSSWNQVHQGPGNANKVAILEGGLTAKDTTYSPADAEMTAAQQAKALEISRLFRVPPDLIGLRSETVGNAEQKMLTFLSTNIGPRCGAIQGELDLKLIGRGEQARGVCTRHDTRSLMRGDMAARIAYYSGRFNLGTITPDEIRQAEGDKPFGLPQSEVAYLPTNNLTRLDKVGEEPTQPAASDPKEPADDAKISDDGAAQSDDNAG